MVKTTKNGYDIATEANKVTDEISAFLERTTQHMKVLSSEIEQNKGIFEETKDCLDKFMKEQPRKNKELIKEVNRLKTLFKN